jgi:hypothetical protein
MQKPLPARPSLEQFKKQAKDLVKDHRSRSVDAFSLIREFLPSLAGKTDEEITLFPFALHDAQSVVARQYGFDGWNRLRDHLAAASAQPALDAAVETRFRTICRAYERGDYAGFRSVMNEAMIKAIPPENFESVGRNLAAYFKAAYLTAYMGEMSQGEHAVHFWRLSAPGANDVLIRMAVKDDLVSGLLFTPPFGGAGGKK